MASVASTSVSGVVKVQQNGIWSNAITYAVPGRSATMTPNIMNMVGGDMRSIQALDGNGNPVLLLTA